jgi:hypothetical protein
MKIAISLVAILLFFTSTNAQWRTIGKNKYEKKFKFAVSKTNADYPVIFIVTTNFIENGKRVRTVTEFSENQSLTYRRIRRMTVTGGRTTNTYQVSVGPRVFCSDDGVSWKVSKFECWDPVSIYGPREPESGFALKVLNPAHGSGRIRSSLFYKTHLLNRL